ncbi:MAG: GAF domain-containing protein [Planctomycetota bacterium]|nr:GAF domain-containing protein [Planctomycetota bacterium]
MAGTPAHTLAEVLTTPELSRRPARNPDWHAESLALAGLLNELASSPATIYQRLVETARDLTKAGTAGLSLLDTNGPEPVFRWAALVGQHAEHVGGTMPRHNSPCGVVLDERTPQLFSNVGRYYPSLALDPPFVEVLLLPFFVDDQPLGTLWVVATEDQRKFDAEDVRILSNLCEFASIAAELRPPAESDSAQDAAQPIPRRTSTLQQRHVRRLEAKLKVAADLAKAQAGQLQALAGRAEDAEHNERRKLALVLHNDLQQLLCAAQMHLDLAKRDSGTQALREALASANDLVRQSLDASRSLTTDMDPPILREGTLLEALEWLGTLMHARHRLTTTVVAQNAPGEISMPMKRLVFAAVRELLFNVVKYARVREARVELAVDGDLLGVVVEDRGTGFDPRVKPAAGLIGGSGLSDIRERMDAAGGGLTIHSEPGTGTRAMLWIPHRRGGDHEARKLPSA